VWIKEISYVKKSAVMFNSGDGYYKFRMRKKCNFRRKQCGNCTE
jgi:hypothetical protein